MSSSTPTVHVVFDAHIDPVWAWSWPSGLDAARDEWDVLVAETTAGIPPR